MDLPICPRPVPSKINALYPELSRLSIIPASNPG